MIKNFKIDRCSTCKKELSLIQVVKLLKRNKSKVLIVLDKERPFGIITLSDIVFKGILSGKNLKKIKAEFIASKEIHALDEEEDECKAYMYMLIKNHLFCPITKKGKFKGILSLSELVKKHVAGHCNFKA